MEYQLPPYGFVGGTPRPPNPAQAALHSSDRTFKLFMGGVGAGKTHWGIRELVLSALANGADQRYIIGAPSEKILRQATFDGYLRFCNACAQANGRRLAIKVRTSPANREIVLQGNIVLSFVGLKKPHEFAGPTIAGFHLDEGGLLSDGLAAWDVLLERLRADAPRLFGIVTTTPRGPVGVVQHFVEQCDWDDDAGRPGPNRNPEYDMRVSTTWDNRENLAPGYIERQLVGKTQRQVDQQLRAKVLDFKGAVYAGEFGQQSIARGWTPDNGLDPDTVDVFLAIDWGPNYPHLLYIAHDREADVDVIFDELCGDGFHARDLLEEAVVRGRAKYGLHRYDYAGVYADPNPASAMETARAYFGRPAKHSDQRRRNRAGWVPVRSWTVRGLEDLRDGIDTVSWRLKDYHGRRRLFFAPQLRDTKSRRRIMQCMRLYAWKERSVQSTTVLDDLRPDKGVYDHGPDALRMFCWQRYRHVRYADARKAADAEGDARQ